MKKSKNKIDKYTLALIRENLPFLLLLAVNFLILIFLKNYYFQNYKKNLTRLAELETEVNRLIKAKQKFANLKFPKEKLDLYFTAVNNLVPEKENAFSIISALENLSSSTRFYITSYSINFPKLQEAKVNTVEVVVSGSGDPEAFSKLLEEYNFTSGRLITMDKLNFSASNVSDIKLVFQFHTHKSPKLSNITQVVLPNNEEIDWFEKVVALLKTSSTLPLDLEEIVYTTKPNPFQ